MCIYDVYITIYARIYLYVRNILILILLLVRSITYQYVRHTYEINGKISNYVLPLFHIPPRNPFATYASPFYLHGRALTKVLSVKTRRMFIACRSCDVSCLDAKYVFIFVLIGGTTGGNIDDRVVKIS